MRDGTRSHRDLEGELICFILTLVFFEDVINLTEVSYEFPVKTGKSMKTSLNLSAASLDATSSRHNQDALNSLPLFC